MGLACKLIHTKSWGILDAPNPPPSTRTKKKPPVALNKQKHQRQHHSASHSNSPPPKSPNKCVVPVDIFEDILEAVVSQSNSRQTQATHWKENDDSTRNTEPIDELAARIVELDESARSLDDPELSDELGNNLN